MASLIGRLLGPATLLNHLPGPPKNLLIIRNPGSGGGRGERVFDHQLARLLQVRGWRVRRLEPQFSVIHQSIGDDIHVSDFLKKYPIHNAFTTTTLKGDPGPRIAALTRTIDAIQSVPQTGRLVVDCIGGDGTQIEVKTACTESVGIFLNQVMRREIDPIKYQTLLARAPLILPSRGGTACDIPTALGFEAKDDIVQVLREAKPISMPTGIAQVTTRTDKILLDVSHSISAGAGAVLFAAAEHNKYGFWKGTVAPYFLAVPQVVLDKAGAWLQGILESIDFLRQNENPRDLDSFYVHYQVNQGPMHCVPASDFLISGLRYVGGALYSPATPIDGLVVYILPANTMGTLGIAFEAGLRGAGKKAMGDKGSSVLLGNRLITMAESRQISLKPGDTIEARFTTDQDGILPRYVPWQANGEPQPTQVSEIQVTVGQPYPYLAKPKSREAVRRLT